MSHRPLQRPHPALPVPAAHRDFLGSVAWSALDLLGTDAQADLDIQGAALIVSALAEHYTVEGAAQAVSEALAGLDSLAAGAVPRDAARAACRPLVEVFDALLQVTTWARLQAAQDVAEAELRQWVTE